MQSVAEAQAQRQRQASVTTALAAEGIPDVYAYLKSNSRYVDEAKGTLEEALQRARECHARRQAEEQRYERMEGLLEQYDIALRHYSGSVPALDAFLKDGSGDEQTAVLDVRAEKNRREAGWVQPPEQVLW
jgi:DNA repair ATPase RecN